MDPRAVKEPARIAAEADPWKDIEQRLRASICHAREGDGRSCREKYGVGSWCSACLGHAALDARAASTAEIARLRAERDTYRNGFESSQEQVQTLLIERDELRDNLRLAQGYHQAAEARLSEQAQEIATLRGDGDELANIILSLREAAVGDVRTLAEIDFETEVERRRVAYVKLSEAFDAEVESRVAAEADCTTLRAQLANFDQTLQINQDLEQTIEAQRQELVRLRQGGH